MGVEDAKAGSDATAPATTTGVEERAHPTQLADEHPGGDNEATKRPNMIQHCLSILSWMPPWCRWDPEKPPVFSIWMNLLFAFAGAFTVANLYYNHPILNILAKDFDVPYIAASRVPTLMQGGYATGLLFICPLGDLFPRRPFTLLLVLFTATMWYAHLPKYLASSLTQLGLACASQIALTPS